LLEIATQLQETNLNTRNKIVILFFGALHVPSGISGREYYWNSLTADEQSRYGLLVEPDGVGSSNFGRFISTNNAEVAVVAEDFFESSELTFVVMEQNPPSLFPGDLPYARIRAHSSGGANKAEQYVELFGGDTGPYFPQ